MMGYDEQILGKMREESRCPVCALLEDLEFEILSQLQYNVTEDEAVRNAIAKAGGFCDFHFRRFRKLANDRTNALLLLALIREYCERSEGIAIRCQVCEDIASYEAWLLKALNSMLHGNDFREQYEQVTGLCICHMQEVQHATDSAAERVWLQSCQIRQMRDSIPSLQQMVERSYFETTLNQRRTIPGSVEKFVGRKSVGL